MTSQNQHGARVSYGTNNSIKEQVIIVDDDSEEGEVLPSKPSKLGVKNEGGFFSRFLKKKKSRTLSRHDITTTRSETEVKKKIQLVNETAQKTRSLPRVERAEEDPEPGTPLLLQLSKTLNCGQAEPLAAKPRVDFDKSLAQMRSALTDGRKIYLDDMGAVAAEVFVRLLVAAGDILKATGKTTEGLECLLEGAQICRKHPPLRDLLAIALNDVGLIHCDNGDYKEAKKSLLESHAILRDINGDVHPDVAVSAGNLGMAYSGCKENSASSDMIGNAIRGMESIYGKDHEYTLQQRGLLGSSLITAGDSNEAKKELRAVISRLDQMQIYPAGHPFLVFLQKEYELALRGDVAAGQ